MIVLILAVIVGIATGFVLSALAKNKGPLEIFGASVFFALGIYLVLIVGNVLSFIWFYDFAHSQLLNVSWSLDPYLLRALSLILATAYFALTPIVVVSIATFKNRRFAIWFSTASAGTCVLLYLISLASPPRFFDAEGHPVARYYRNPETDCIELFFNQDVRVHPKYSTELAWVTPNVVRDWERQQKLGRNPASCKADAFPREKSIPVSAAAPNAQVPPPRDTHKVNVTSDSPSNFISSLDAKVQHVWFYEATSSGTAYPDRRYASRFASKTTRYVYWELSAVHPRHSSKRDFMVDAIWYGPDGKEMWRQSTAVYIDAEWTSTTWGSGWGNEGGGAFRIGNYRVELFVDGIKVAVGSFEVYEG